MSILFINSSPNRNGNTARLAKVLLAGKDYETLQLMDYRIDQPGQVSSDDQLDELVAKMKAADTVVIGSPDYWHNLTGALRTVFDRFYGPVANGEFSGRDAFLIFQGAAPTKDQLTAVNYTVGRFCSMYGMDYQGMASNEREAKALSGKVR